MDHAANAIDQRIDLALALDKLPECDRRIIVLYYIEGYTQAEIGEMVGIDQPSLCREIARICYELRQVLT